MQDLLPLRVHGHLKITDDLGNVLVDKKNAIHPQNMARVISRALAHESNYFIKYIAFGNGGTDIDAALNISFNPPNDGQAPDTRTWDSALYNETYREIVDDSDPDVGDGVGATPEDDPATVEHVSGPGAFSSELGILSQVVVRSTLNRNEPTGQVASGTDEEGANFDTSFTFDEIGLFTGGLPLSASAGYQSVEVGPAATVNSSTDTGLLVSTQYGFTITVDGGTPTDITFTTPGTGAPFTYGDLCEALNTQDWSMSQALPGGATVAITDTTGDYPTIVGAQTFGFLRFTSPTTGASSSIALSDTTAATFGLFDPTNGLNPAPAAGSTILTATVGVDAGVQNDPVNSLTEAERMLSHVIFAPVLKANDRELNIIYTLTVAVARSS